MKEWILIIARIVLIVFLFCYISGIYISIRPFVLRLDDWKRTLIMFVVLILVFMYGHISHNIGADKACRDMMDTMDKVNTITTKSVSSMEEFSEKMQQRLKEEK